MGDFTVKEAVSKFNKKVITLVNLSQVYKASVPKNSEGKVDAVSMNGKQVRVRFQVTIYEWFDKHEYETFLEEV